MSHNYPLRRRAAVLGAAAELFASEGFGATTLEPIAERATLHVQTLYRHFPTKQALAAALERETKRRRP